MKTDNDRDLEMMSWLLVERFFLFYCVTVKTDNDRDLENDELVTGWILMSCQGTELPEDKKNDEQCFDIVTQ